jgi:hypothetical protein
VKKGRANERRSGSAVKPLPPEVETLCELRARVVLRIKRRQHVERGSCQEVRLKATRRPGDPEVSRPNWVQEPSAGILVLAPEV